MLHCPVNLFTITFLQLASVLMLCSVQAYNTRTKKKKTLDEMV